MRIIAGRWRGHPLTTPGGQRTRPTTDRVREAWMSVLQHDLPGARVLDLFAGSGALGLEALSRGAAHATFVERAAAPLKALEANIRRLQPESVEVVKDDALRYARRLEADAFDIVVADPPYDEGHATALVELFLERGFARILAVEHRTKESLDHVAGAHTRRYGDTALTFVMREP
ncbi:MAG TPA: 16S rRNA (guanine(966)-N(2))-methyltransferase RsmD [Longimicrobiales bacterium]|nr:16S rRNA (guanine(966)-N(2))-methyltransferase RsmD [Longimicrobiales bacterium]